MDDVRGRGGLFDRDAVVAAEGLLAQNRHATTTGGTVDEDRSAGRWCERCGRHGSHHTDRHEEFAGGTVDGEPGVGAVVQDAEGTVFGCLDEGIWCAFGETIVFTWAEINQEQPVTLLRPATPGPTPQPFDFAPDDEVEALAQVLYGVERWSGDYETAETTMEASLRLARALHAHGYRQVGDARADKTVEQRAQRLYDEQREPGNFDFEWDELSAEARDYWRRVAAPDEGVDRQRAVEAFDIDGLAAQIAVEFSYGEFIEADHVAAVIRRYIKENYDYLD